MNRSRREIEEQERRARDGGSGDETVEMRIDFEIMNRLVLSCGGLWHRADKEYVGDADACTSGVVVRPHEGQVTPVEWFVKWIAVHAGRRDNPPPVEDDEDLLEIDTDPARVFSALFAGGRRGGKTWIAAAICAAYALQFPGSIIWAVSPARGKDDTKPDEIRRYMSELLAPTWIERQTLATGWELINGSAIMLKTAHTGADPDAIKEGMAHLIWMNEGQKMKQRVYTVARGAISDKSGLVLVCANPPVEAKDQQWVTDFAADAAAGRRASAYLEFDPRKNPHINRRALFSMSAELDERSYRIEVLGQFLPPAEVVAWNWIRLENEKKIPGPSSSLVDVTSEFLEFCEEGQGFTDVVGLDVQRFPYIGGPIYRFFAAPKDETNRETVIAWIVGEIVLEGGDEVAWCDELRKKKLDPETTLIICDATAEYQHSRRRQADSPPPEWHGRGSWSVIRGEGYTHIVAPSRRFRKKNPEIVDRVRSMTSLICTKTGRRRLFADPDLAPKSCQAIRNWTTVHGKPSRTQDVAHLGDGISYVTIRLFPRILRSDKTNPVDGITERVDQPESSAGVIPAPRARAKRGRWL